MFRMTPKAHPNKYLKYLNHNTDKSAHELLDFGFQALDAKVEQSELAEYFFELSEKYENDPVIRDIATDAMLCAKYGEFDSVFCPTTIEELKNKLIFLTSSTRK